MKVEYGINIFVPQSTQGRRIGASLRAGARSRGNGVMCKVDIAPQPGPWTKTPQTVSNTLCKAPKKRGNPQRIRGLKGLPVIMPNGSNLEERGVNELVSVLPFEPGDDHLAGRAIV